MESYYDHFYNHIEKGHLGDDFLINPKKLFEKGEHLPDWEHYHYSDGFLRVKSEAYFQNGGICGNFGLWIPPKDHDVDAWEASRLAGEEDWWGFLNFISVPDIKTTHWSQDKKSEPKIIIYFPSNTFFGRELEVVKIINPIEYNVDPEEVWMTVNWEIYDGTAYSVEVEREDIETSEALKQAWSKLLLCFERSIGAKKVESNLKQFYRSESAS